MTDPNQAITAARLDDQHVRVSYDRVPYPALAQRQSHPDNLATRAFLLNMEPPAVTACRVLELGCSDGGNLIPIAIGLPGCECVGIDISPRQIEAGRSFVKSLGLSNVRLVDMSLLDVDAEFGKFDYIIAHGIFSWVAEGIQEKILAICRQHLAPQGVAYVSYNTLPGWHLHSIVRDTMRYHTRKMSDLEARAKEAVDFINCLADNVTRKDDARAVFLNWTKDYLAKSRDTYLVHEYLEEHNRPLYLHQFVERAGKHGLQYLADATPTLGEHEVESLPAVIAAKLRSITRDRIELEQYVDFVTNRSFRRSLLCHAGVSLGRAVNPERTRHLHAAAPVVPVEASPDVTSSDDLTFRTHKGKELSSGHPMTKAALVCLGQVWPGTLSFGQLLENVCQRLGVASGDQPAEALGALLRSCFLRGIVQLRTTASPAKQVSQRPAVSELTRRQAAAGETLTTQFHDVVRMDQAARIILRQLDGTRDFKALIKLLLKEAAADNLQVQHDGVRVTDEAQRREIMERLVPRYLQSFAANALLVG
jgi:methyltransferase-like protein